MYWKLSSISCDRAVRESTKDLLIGMYLNEVRMTDHIVKTQIKETVDADVSAEFYRALDEEVVRLLERAEERAEQNDRQTVLPQDV